MNNIKDAIQCFNMNSLKPTLIEVRQLDGSIIKMNKYGLEIEKNDKSNQLESDFSSYGFIPNFNLDLQIGKIELPEFKILFGKLI